MKHEQRVMDMAVAVTIPMKIHLVSRHPAESGFYGLFVKGLGRDKDRIYFVQASFSARNQQWFSLDTMRKSTSGLSERLDIVAWAECPNINSIVSEYSAWELETTLNKKED